MSVDAESSPRGEKLLNLATFWAGPTLPALDRACLASFAQHGHVMRLYSFEEVGGLPEGVTWQDAARIVPRESVDAFIYQGKPNLSHFSDYFRYRLFTATDETWVDTDMVSLKPAPASLISAKTGGSLFAKETPSSICGAIMRIDNSNDKLSELLKRTESLMNTELVWGATGPRLLNQVLGLSAMLGRAYAPEVFYPVHYDLFWKPLLPEHRDECASLSQNAFTLHLWNNIVVRLGYWKEVAPPEGSFLWTAFRDAGVLHLFKDTYPVDVMRHMVTNWLLRKSGGDIGVLKVMRQFAPSVARTFGPRIRGLIQRRR